MNSRVGWNSTVQRFIIVAFLSMLDWVWGLWTVACYNVHVYMNVTLRCKYYATCSWIVRPYPLSSSRSHTTQHALSFVSIPHIRNPYVYTYLSIISTGGHDFTILIHWYLINGGPVLNRNLQSVLHIKAHNVSNNWERALIYMFLITAFVHNTPYDSTRI